ncbi:unnamed protein product, partial [Amoebophrya sp. A25]
NKCFIKFNRHTKISIFSSPDHNMPQSFNPADNASSAARLCNAAEEIDAFLRSPVLSPTDHLALDKSIRSGHHEELWGRAGIAENEVVEPEPPEMEMEYE